MNFLKFYVILCLHTVVSTLGQNNGRNVLYEQPTTNIVFQTNSGTSSEERPVQNPAGTILTRSLLQDLNGERSKNLQNEGLSHHSYQTKRIENNVQFAPESGNLEQINSMYNKQENSHEPQPSEPSMSIPITRHNVNRNLLRVDRGNIILPNTYKKRDNVNSDRKVINYNYHDQPSIKLPLNPEKETRLDSQGISFENINPLTSTSSLGSPPERQLPSVTNLELDEDRFNSIPIHVINKAKELHSFHASAKNLKRYMIVHSDGTVEHVDDLEMNADKYPNYIMIKSTDLEKYAQIDKKKLPASISENQSGVTSANAHHSENSLTKQKAKKVFPELTKNKNVDVIKPNQSAELLSKLSPEKETISRVPLKTFSSDSTPKQDPTKKIPTQMYMRQGNSINIDLSRPLKNSTTVSPVINLKDEDKNNNNISSSWIPINIKEDEIDNNNITACSPGSPTPILENIDYSGIWFQDRDFWDKLQNGTHNILYFFFAPPSPQVKKETKIIIYPNGTQVEEITEIFDDEDGIPQALKTTKVTHATEDTNT